MAKVTLTIVERCAIQFATERKAEAEARLKEVLGEICTSYGLPVDGQYTVNLATGEFGEPNA